MPVQSETLCHERECGVFHVFPILYYGDRKSVV